MGFCWNEQKLCRMGMHVGEPSFKFHLLRRVPWAVQYIHRGKNSQIERLEIQSGTRREQNVRAPGFVSKGVCASLGNVNFLLNYVLLRIGAKLVTQLLAYLGRSSFLCSGVHNGKW